MTPSIENFERVATVMSHASDPTRLRMLQQMWDGEIAVNALAGTLNISQPTVSHHLSLLRMGAIVSRRRDGKNAFYSLTEVGRLLVDFACHV